MSRPPTKDVIRLALTPRWLALGAIALLFIAAAIFLGRWQWERTQDVLAAERAALSQPVAIEQVLPLPEAGDPPLSEIPPEGMGRPVTITGVYDPNMQVAVVNREHQGKPGVWIVTGLRMADGRVAAILRGWLPSATSPGVTPPSGEVTVSGMTQPDEGFYADAANDPGTVASIAHDRLATLWNATLLPGYTVLTSAVPDSSPAPVPVVPTVQTANVPFPLQNFAYAFQWWIFALFALVVYVRWLMLDARDEADEAARTSSVDYGGAP
jgi:cytochrome oxidase assembly protein ShyY1